VRAVTSADVLFALRSLAKRLLV